MGAERGERENNGDGEIVRPKIMKNSPDTSRDKGRRHQRKVGRRTRAGGAMKKSERSGVVKRRKKPREDVSTEGIGLT